MEIQELYSIFRCYPTIETDSRKAGPGKIFLALKGERFNGNEFAMKAIEAGCEYAIVDEKPAGAQHEKLIYVDDSLATLQNLAKYHRQQFSIPFIAITGSNGKTTTKELVHVVLSKKYRTYTTEGNLNNHIGIPLTLLKVRPDAEIAIVEMGANHQREIASYCAYTFPTHGLITNCGKAHLEGFGGEEGVKKGKGELFDYLKEKDGTVFINNDYDYLQHMSRGIAHIVGYGTESGELVGKGETRDGMLEVFISKGMEPCTIRSQLVGEYNLPNVLAAACIGRHFSVEDRLIQEAIEGYHPTNSRSQLLIKGSNRIIMDAYNANPSSMRAAIENFAAMDDKNKVVMLGAMMEMGEVADEEHAALIALLQSKNWKQVVLVGKEFKEVPPSYLHFNDVSEAAKWYSSMGLDNCSILIKGSRSMQMERIVSENN
jgi:UDP-N-acetylmuramoyl-tripeptide--D-alanyl-D-alanine ligase